MSALYPLFLNLRGRICVVVVEYTLWVEKLGELRRHLFQVKEIPVESRLRILHEQVSAPAFERFRDSLKESGNDEVQADLEGSSPCS